MRKLVTFITFVISILFMLQLNSQNFQFQGNITNDTTWSADTLEITGEVNIDSNITLTVLPGTFIHILGYYAIWSYGNIVAIGTETDSIIFTHLDTIHHNDTSTRQGGWHGIRLMPRSSPDTSIFSYCRISNGKSVVPGSWWSLHIPENQGGNIYGTDFGSIVLTNCYILNGRAKIDGGGIYLANGDYVNIEQCDFRYNHAYIYGGGAWIRTTDQVFINNCLFYFNECYNYDAIGVGGQGSGIALEYSLGYYAYALIENNRFFNNKTGAGTIFDSYYNSEITGNIICNNFGSGLCNAHMFNHAVYTNNTIVNNVAWMYSGITTISSDIKLINNIVRNNRAFPNYPIEQIFYNVGYVPPPEVSYCNVEFGWEGEGEGNFDSIAHFTNPTLGIGQEYDALAADWSLQDISPCINAGTPDTSGLYLPALDIAGNPRIYGGRIDVGGYENQNVLVYIKEPSFIAEEISIYPNPGRGEFFIELQPGIADAWIELVDITGKQVFHSQIITNPAVFSTTGLKPGIYFYRIHKQQQVIKTGKWIKQ